MLKADTLTAVANVGAPAARWKTRAFSAPPIEKAAEPNTNTATASAYGCGAAAIRSRMAAARPASPPRSVASGLLSARRPPTITPARDPSPKASNTAGTKACGTPETCNSTGTR
jgi:hypothetical protein